MNDELKHLCHAKGCSAEVPPSLLMCSHHWRMVPEDLQRRVWRTYRKGQEIDKRPSEAYLAAMREAIEAVSTIEGRKAAPETPRELGSMMKNAANRSRG